MSQKQSVTAGLVASYIPRWYTCEQQPVSVLTELDVNVVQYCYIVMVDLDTISLGHV